MTCHVCGAAMREVVTDLPFKVGPVSIVILKGLPVGQCMNCTEFALEDVVLQRVDVILGEVDAAAELEIVSYAA